MRILFTGASSFTGCWFVKELAAAGHEVVMTFRRPVEQYEGVRRQRVEMAMKLGRPVFGCCFGDEKFVQLIGQETGWDVLCHHAADVTNYKSPDFDVHAAVQNNTFQLRAVLDALAEKGCRKVVLSGSFFEGGEGAGSDGLPPLSAYGLSKELTARIFHYYVQVAGMRLGKFVIPNPFGPLEEPRFTTYLARCWFEGKVAAVNTPAYVRDNIHVSLLAKAYVRFAQQLRCEPGFQKTNPSGYVESQGAFAERVAAEMRPRLGLECRVELKRQVDFSEPMVRLNTDTLSPAEYGGDEADAWNALAEYYRSLFSGRRTV
jgi:UDP-glucose 4-epimerase